jgi:hypothetical protein
VLTGRDFGTELEATTFGEVLKVIVELAALYARLGADVGTDKPTGWIREEFAREHGIIGEGERLAPNIHGLIVVPDDDTVIFPIMTIEGKVTAEPGQLLGAIREIGEALPLSRFEIGGAVRLFSSALMQSDNLAQLTLAISAVETLGQGERWTAEQRWLLESFAKQAEAAGTPEGTEVADAVRRGTHRVGLRQGVLRVLSRLGLETLKAEWDRIYGLRSGMFHGTAPLSGQQTGQLALDAVSLCGRVIVEEARALGFPVATVADKHYASPHHQASTPSP